MQPNEEKTVIEAMVKFQSAIDDLVDFTVVESTILIERDFFVLSNYLNDLLLSDLSDLSDIEEKTNDYHSYQS